MVCNDWLIHFEARALEARRLKVSHAGWTKAQDAQQDI